MNPPRYQLFRLYEDGSVKHLQDTTKASLGIMATKISKQLSGPVVAIIDRNDGSKPERFLYEKGRLISKLPSL